MLGLGDLLEVPCDLDDLSEPVAWFKDGAVLTPTNRTRVGQRLLRITNVSYEDSGIYVCRLARHRGSGSSGGNAPALSNYTVRVTGEPHVGQRKHLYTHPSATVVSVWSPVFTFDLREGGEGRREEEKGRRRRDEESEKRKSKGGGVNREGESRKKEHIGGQRGLEEFVGGVRSEEESGGRREVEKKL